MPWNYRVFKVKSDEPDKEELLTIKEAYYEEGVPPDGKPYACKDASLDSIEGLENLRWELEAMLRSLDKPVLDYEEFCN